MGYKVHESQIAQKLNYHYAMYQGYPVYLVGECTGSHYDGENREWKLNAVKVGDSAGSFRVNIEEPTFSAAALQAGYCFDESGRLAYLHSNCGALTNEWNSNDYFLVPTHTSKKLYDCFMNKHPKFLDAVKAVTVSPRKKACSFDRNFALVRDGTFSDIEVHYRGKSIGFYDAKNMRLKLRTAPMIKLLKRKLDKLME